MKRIRPPRGRVRVLHVVDSLEIGGVARVLTDLIEQTGDELEHQIFCVRRAGALAAHLTALGVPVNVLGAPSGQTVFLIAPLVRLCRTRAPDILHARNWGTIEAVFAGRLARVPTVIYGEHGPGSWGGRRHAWGRRAACAAADAVVAVSNAVRDYLSAEVGVRAAKIVVVRNGVDAARFRPHADHAQLRRARGLPADGLLIGGVGRLDPIKNYAALIAAFAEVARRHTDCRLILIGDGPARDRLRDDVRARGLDDRVSIVGMRDDVADWLALLDVFAHVSLAEGLSNALLQAMAAGLPVVATDLAANREVVLDGVTGRLVDGGSASALVDALRFYGADAAVRCAHGAAGRRRVEAEFPLQRTIDGYRALYRQHTAAAAGA